MVGFIFGGNTGLNYEDLQSRRAAADALAKRIMGQQPKNVGEGIGALLQGAAAGIGRYRADKGLKEGRTQASSQFDDIFSRITGQPAPAAAGGSAGLPSSDVAGEMAASSPAPGGDYFSSIRSAESGGNDSAKNPNSSATGRYQFIDSTWRGLMQKYPDLGLTANGRTDPAQQERAIQAFTRDNAQTLQGAGIPTTGGNLYAAHFLGAGGAKNVLSGDPSAPVSNYVGKGVVEANPFLQGMTVSQFQNWANRKGGGNQPVDLGGTQVASIDPSVGMPATAAIEQQAPGSGYVDPAVAAPSSQAPVPMQPSFDASRFGDPIKLAEMPPSQAELPAGLASQASAYTATPQAPQQPTGALSALPANNVGAAPQVTSAPQQAVPQQVAQAQPPQYQPPQAQPYQMDPAVIKFLSNPFADEGQKQAVRMAVQQQMQASQQAQEEQTWRARQDYTYQQQQNDPLRQAQISALQAKTGQGDGEEWGLNPVWGKDKDGNTVLGQVSKAGKFKPLDTGDFQPTPGINNIDTGTQIITRDSRTGNTISATPKENFKEAYDTAAGGTAGKTDVGVKEEFASITSKMPGLYVVVDRLGDLAKKATYTIAGQANDWTRNQLGVEPREEAVARAEYTAMVDNQILPLLRDTFGAQFTNEEGIRLAKTLGDADKSPTEKQALLRAFIEQKERDIQALQNRMGSAPNQAGDQPNVQTNPPRTPDEATGMPSIKQGRSAMPRPTTEAEFNALPSGALYIDPDDNQQYRKP